MAELADAHGSGPCSLTGLGVQLPPSAPDFILKKKDQRLGIKGKVYNLYGFITKEEIKIVEEQ